MPPPIYTGTQNNSPNYTHTAGSFMGYTPKPGQLFIAPFQFGASGAGSTLARDGAGLWRLRVAASTTVTLVADLGLILSQLAFPPLPNQAGGSGPFIYKNTNNNQNIGITINSVQAFYKTLVANLTSATLGVYQSVMPADNTAAAPTVTNILAPTTLSLPFRANMYNTTFTPALAAQIPLATALSEILAEIAVVTPASSTFDLYGIMLNLSYSY